MYEKGKAIMLDRITYFMESKNRLSMMKARPAPIVLMRAKSNPFLYIPTFNMLFIIKTLRTNKLKMISFRITPINIPK